jgi:hypothetical protein
VYARRAAGYRFVRSVLEELFGVDALGQMHRLTREGPCGSTVSDELTAIEKLFGGAAVTARRELGMGAVPADEEDARRFATWRTNLAADRDVNRDCRMMVPVFFDLQRRMTKVWAFLGWRTVSVDVEYRTEPLVLRVERERLSEPEPTDRLNVLRRKFRKQSKAEPEKAPTVELCGDRYDLAVPVMAEVYISRLLDRDEFRLHCDRHKTKEAILSNLH